jgi:hypothetical protein
VKRNFDKDRVLLNDLRRTSTNSEEGEADSGDHAHANTHLPLTIRHFRVTFVDDVSAIILETTSTQRALESLHIPYT